MGQIIAKSLLNKNKKRDDWFLGNYTLNPYAGCSIACIYCYTRGSKYGGDHGSTVNVKSQAVPILKRQLKNAIKRHERGFIVLGSAADPYPSVENETKLTREILGLIKRYHFPLHILTKSNLILRDIDILTDIKEEAINLLKNINDMDISEIAFAIKKIQEYKVEIGDYLDILAVWYRDVLLFKATNDVNHLIFKEEIQYIRKVADRCTYEGIEAIIQALFKAKNRLSANVNFDLTIELLFVTIKEDGGL